MLASMLMIVMVVAKGVSSIPIDRNFEVECEKEVSLKGVNYFTIVVFSMKIAVPCPPGTVYWHSICDCDHPRTDAVTTLTVSKTTESKERTTTPSQTTDKTTRKPLVQTTTAPVVPTTRAPIITSQSPGCRAVGKGFEEYITDLGWVYSDCFGGKTFKQELCRCVDPPFVCPYTPHGNGFVENIPGVGPVYSDCPSQYKFNSASCKCTLGGKNTDPQTDNDHAGKVCVFTASGNGYIENIPGVGDVYSDCPPGHHFNSRKCRCVLKGKNTDPQTDNDNAGKVCVYTASGNGYIEKIPGVGDVYNDCPPGHHFNSRKCRCVLKGTGGTGVDFQIPTTLAPTHVTNKDCHYTPNGDGYTEHIPGVGDVHYDCATGHTFNVVVCSCIKKGTRVTLSPVVPDSNADTVCKFTSTRDGYTEHIPGVGDVYYDCPSGHTFNALVCKCIKKGTPVIVTPALTRRPNTQQQGSHITKPPPASTQKPTSHITKPPPASTQKPTSQVTNPDCHLIPDGNGYIESIPGVGDIYNDCPSSQIFDVSLCKCKNPNKASNDHSEPNKDDTTKGPKSDCSRQETETGGFLEFVPGFGMVDGDCGPRKRFDGSLCSCVEIKN